MCIHVQAYAHVSIQPECAHRCVFAPIISKIESCKTVSMMRAQVDHQVTPLLNNSSSLPAGVLEDSYSAKACTGQWVNWHAPIYLSVREKQSLAALFFSTPVLHQVPPSSALIDEYLLL